MSPDTSDDGHESTVSLDAVSTQLRSYGRWLEERSDVELSAADVAFLEEIERNGFRSRPRVLAGVAAAVALAVVVVAGLGIGNRSGGGEQLEAGPAGRGGVSTAEPNRDTPTSDRGSADRPAVGTDGDRSPGDVPAVDDLAAGIVDGTADPEAPDGSPTAGGAADQPEAADPVVGDDPASDGAPVEDPSGPDNAVTPSTVDTDEDANGDDSPPWNPPANGGSGFVTPTSGAVLDLNAMNTLRARPVAGATAYVFEGWQNDLAVMSTSADEPTLVIPSRLITAGVMGQVEPGPLRLTVTAKDAAGTVLATGEIQVTIAGPASSAAQDFVDDNPFTGN